MQNEITELRNQVRTLKRVVYGFGCLLVAGIVVGATSLQTVPDLIQAKRFEVINSKGKPCVVLDSMFDGGKLDIYDHNDDWSIMMSSVINPLTPDGPPTPKIYMFAGGFGHLGIEMGVTQDYGGKIETGTLFASREIKTTTTETKNLIANACLMRNSEGTLVCGFGPDNEGNGLIRTYNNKGKTTSQTP